MRHRFLLTFIFAGLSLAMKAQTINYVEQNGSWIYVYDDSNHKLCTKYVGNSGSVVGWGGDYWISRCGDWYYLWTAKGTKYKSLYAPNIGDIVGVSSKTFVSRYNKQWLYTFDKNGKKIATKYSPKK